MGVIRTLTRIFLPRIKSIRRILFYINASTKFLKSSRWNLTSIRAVKS